MRSLEDQQTIDAGVDTEAGTGSSSTISDYRQSLEFQSLNKEKPNIHVEAQVIRGGRRLCIPISDIVIGDVVHLHVGDKVPADGILINGHSLAIDESNMTGEARINQKDLQSPFLMAGCVVADGYGTMLVAFLSDAFIFYSGASICPDYYLLIGVTGVGLFTERGVLMATILEDNGEETPLQVHLNGVATYIGISGLVLALFVLVVLMIRFFSGNTRNPDGTVQFRPGTTGVAGSMDEAVKIFTIAVSIGIVAVPEGLPLAIILTTPLGGGKVAQRGHPTSEDGGSLETHISKKWSLIKYEAFWELTGFGSHQNSEVKRVVDQSNPMMGDPLGSWS
ncbi:hypothetical protein LguiB_021379 [Lonicera macranthoides]